MEHEELQDTLTIGSRQHLKAMSHPLRIAIVRLLREEAMTNEELARALGVASGKLYFHTRQLLDAGLIRLVGTRQKRAITEKLYRTTARRFRVVSSLDEDALTGVDQIESAVQLYRNTSQEYPALVSSDHTLVRQCLLLLPPYKAKEIHQRLLSLTEEAMETKSTDADAVPLALTVLMHPLPGPIQATEDTQCSPSAENMEGDFDA